MKKIAQAVLLAFAAIAAQGASATTVAIVTGGWYTPDLKNQLVAAGVSVSEMSSYTAASLAGYNAVVEYGNTFVDQNALDVYVSNGGKLLLTPWSGLNFAVSNPLRIFGNGGNAVYSQASPGIHVLNGADPLLAGVNLPTAAGAFTEGRITGIDFVAGVQQVLDWGDGVGMLGYKTHGAGEVFGLNMHLITSDTAYTVIDQPWAAKLVLNIVGDPAAVPEPGSLALVGLGLFGIAASVRRSRKR